MADIEDCRPSGDRNLCRSSAHNSSDTETCSDSVDDKYFESDYELSPKKANQRQKKSKNSSDSIKRGKSSG